MSLYKDRRDAGRQLARELTSYADRPDVVVLALPRGGVPVAFEVAQALHVPLDIFLVRKLGVPKHEELAFGAIASGGVWVLNEEIVWRFNISGIEIERVAQRELVELERRERAYRGEERPMIEIRNRTVILVDDGLATGASMRAAIDGVRAKRPDQIVVAVPTAAPETCALFEDLVDEVVCAETPQPFYGVGRWYQDFSQTTDEEVRMFLEQISKELNY
jgi:putative phosphoribosyl transferase